jgi:asparagine N-glycosylation enzyme membrane subunit Stt3
VPDSQYLTQHNDRGGFVFLIASSVLSFLVLTWLYTSGSGPIKKGDLADTDCYMHLVRASQLYSTGRWYDTLSPRSNAPYGERLHWTRPFDYLLLAGAIPLSHIMGFHSALFWWACILSPLLLALTLIALHYSVKPLVSSDASYLILCVFAFQPVTLSYLQAGRPDHHSLLLFLFVVSLGVNLQVLLKPFAKSWCFAAGALAALAVWISVESILSIGVIVVVLGLFWIPGNQDFAKKGFFYSLALFVAAAISLIIERPPADLMAVEYDRISIVHLALFGLFVLFWASASAAGSSKYFLYRWPRRLSFCLASALLAALVMSISFPGFFKGPYADVEPGLVSIWLSKVAESMPLSPRPFTVSVPFVASAVIFFAFLLRQLLRGGHLINRKGWLYVTILFAVFFAVSLRQIRWIMYAQTLSGIAIAEIISRTLSWLRKHGKGPLIITARLAVIILLSMGFAAAGLLLDMHTGYLNAAKKQKKVHLAPLCAYLNDTPPWRGKTLRILTHVDFGPEILYRTGDEVIATPYHRNGRAILDTYDIMTARTDDQARRLINRRGITTILLCPGSTEESFYSTDKQESTFYARLRQGAVPDWLSPVTLPEDLSSSFLLFQVK